MLALKWKNYFLFFYFYFYLIFFVFGGALSFKTCPSNETHALILARGGSKGIKHKNLRIIDGLSLLARSILEIRQARSFETIWVSTDSKNIAQEAIKYGALVHHRDPMYAQDNTSSLDSVKEFLVRHPTITRFALFQCTSVFLRAHYILEALGKFSNHDCVFAVTRSHKLRWKEQDHQIVPINFNPKQRPRRQDWKGELIETGMFYFSHRQLIFEGYFQNDKCGIVEILPKDALEIDTFYDLLLARMLTKMNTSSSPDVESELETFEIANGTTPSK